LPYLYGGLLLLTFPLRLLNQKYKTITIYPKAINKK